MPKSIRVLTIDNKNIFKYESQYYDTDQMEFYLAHHNQRKGRYKVRTRHYLDTQTKFFEIKKKDHKNTTSKMRRIIDGHNESTLLEQCIQSIDQLNGKHLNKTITTTFNRITLVSEDLKERLTIDSDLSFYSPDQLSIRYKKLIVYELKQGKLNRQSDFSQYLRQLKIRPRSFSKYCLGVSELYNIKHNRFLQQRRAISKIEDYA